MTWKLENTEDNEEVKHETRNRQNSRAILVNQSASVSHVLGPELRASHSVITCNPPSVDLLFDTVFP